MKEEALKLADWLDEYGGEYDHEEKASDMIRKLVAELDDVKVQLTDALSYKLLYQTAPQTKPLSDEEIIETRWNITLDCKNDRDMWVLFARAIEERILAK